MPETISIPEAVARTGKTDRTIRAWLQKGDVAFVRDDAGKRRIVVASLDAYLAASGAAPAARPAALPGLAEIADTMEKQRKELRDALWQVGYLTSQNENKARRIAELEAALAETKLLSAGSDAAPEASPEASPEEETEAEMGRWGRIKAWFVGG